MANWVQILSWVSSTGETLKLSGDSPADVPGKYNNFKLDVFRAGSLYWTQEYTIYLDAVSDWSYRYGIWKFDTWRMIMRGTVPVTNVLVQYETLVVGSTPGPVKYRVNYSDGTIHEAETFSIGRTEFIASGAK